MADDGVRIQFNILARRASGGNANTPEAARVEQVAKSILEAAIQNINGKSNRYSGQHNRKSLAESGRMEPFGATGKSVVFQLRDGKWDIAAIVHNGSNPHSIGKKGKRLYNPHDPARSEGKDPVTPFAFRGQVLHPGAKANPYLDDAVKQTGHTKRSGALKRGRSGPFPVVRAGSFA